MTSKLAIELEGIQYNLNRTDDRMYDIASEWRDNGGICCPYCYSAEYRLLAEKQERREKRKTEIIIKLNKDNSNALDTTK